MDANCFGPSWEPAKPPIAICSIGSSACAIRMPSRSWSAGHGRMVLAVGRRVTGHPQDAEDAFQAAFLVLARRAGQLNRPDQLANWLYGVAYRTALEARAARRRVWERPMSPLPEPIASSPPDDTGDLRRPIDDELAKLPDKYRSAVVLCDLEGVSRTEAASRLRIPEGTLSSRLAYARKLLATRLTRRGISSSAGMVAVALAREAIGSTVPRELVLHTARAAISLTSGAVPPPDLVSPFVSSLTDGVMKTMLVNRLRLTLGILLASGLLGVSAYGIAQVASSTTASSQDPVLAQNAVPADPFFGQNVVEEQKQEKIAAKGIEDEDVPLASSPAQAVVRVEGDKLIVRQRGAQHQTVVITRGQGTTTTIGRKSGIHATTHDVGDVAVFDMRGNRLQTKAWKDKMKNDVHVLIGYDGKLPNPRKLALYKDDTLLVVLPTPAHGAVVWGVNGAIAPLAVPSVPGLPSGAAPLTPRRIPSPARPSTPPPLPDVTPGRP